MSVLIAKMKTEWSETENGFLVFLGGASDTDASQISSFMRRRGMNQVHYHPNNSIPVMVWAGSSAAAFKQTIDGMTEISAIEKIMGDEEAVLATVFIDRKSSSEFLLSSKSLKAIELAEEFIRKIAETDLYFATQIARKADQITVKHPGNELKKILTPA